MVNSQCHSFEDASSAGSHSMSIISESRSGSFHDEDSARKFQLNSINIRLFPSSDGSQASTSPSKANHSYSISSLKENQAAYSASPQRGRSRFQTPFSRESARNAHHSPISPDRFIPKRDFGDSPSTPYRVNRDPQQLSPRERILRRRPPGEDPFLPTPRTSPAFPGQSPKPTRLPQRPLMRPRLVTDLALLGGNRPNDFLRQVSSGTVWGVGGTSTTLGDPSSTPTSGAQSLSGRGSTAPTFVARFLPKSSKADDQKNHESRIALAMDIDPTTRLLSTCGACIQTSPDPTSPEYEQLQPFKWKDNAWKKGERGNCEHFSFNVPSSLFSSCFTRSSPQ